MNKKRVVWIFRIRACVLQVQWVGYLAEQRVINAPHRLHSGLLQSSFIPHQLNEVLKHKKNIYKQV